MKYLDCVEVIVEKEKYTNHGIHKGMQGIVWLEVLDFMKKIGMSA